MSNSDFPKLDAQQFRVMRKLVDIACEEFEATLRPGPAPDIQQFIDERLAPLQSRMTVELLRIEIETRLQRGEPIDASLYGVRFPDHHRVLAEAFGAAADSGLIVGAVDRGTPRLEAGDTIGDYRILKQLDKGGMAQVYLAVDLSERVVALKVSRRESREPHLLCKLSHPKIVKLHSYMRMPGSQELHLLSMEYVPSVSLQRVTASLPADFQSRKRPVELFLGELRRQLGDRADHGELPNLPSQTRWSTFVAWLGTQIAGALAYAHEQGVVHRDIKPSNILICGNAEPTLVDFNVSHDFDNQGKTPPEQHFGGSLPYMSPEHLTAFVAEADVAVVGPPSDVWALGVILHDLLTGANRHADDSVKTRSLHRVATAVRTEISQEELWFPSDTPIELQWVISQCRQQDPADRPTAAEVRRRLGYINSPQLQRITVPDYAAWELRVPRLTTSLYVAGLVGYCFLPHMATITVGGLLYNALITAGIPEKLAVWDADRAWFFGPIFGSMGVLIVLIPSVLYLWPALHAIATTERGLIPRDVSNTISRRTSTVGLLAAGISIAAWLFVGCGTFWTSTRNDATWDAYLDEFLHYGLVHLMNGLVGAASMFLVVSNLSIHFLFFRLVPRADMTNTQQWLPLLRKVTFASLAMTPLAGCILSSEVLLTAPFNQNTSSFLSCLWSLVATLSVLCVIWARQLFSTLEVVSTVFQHELGE